MKIDAITVTAPGVDGLAKTNAFMAGQTRPVDRWRIAFPPGHTFTAETACPVTEHLDARAPCHAMADMLRAAADGGADGVVLIGAGDWYHPEWVAKCERWLFDVEMIGEDRDRRYDLANRTYWQQRSKRRAVSRATAFRAELAHPIAEWLEGGDGGREAGFSGDLWGLIRPSRILLWPEALHHVSIVHDAAPRAFDDVPTDDPHEDPHGVVLEHWIGRRDAALCQNGIAASNSGQTSQTNGGRSG